MESRGVFTSAMFTSTFADQLLPERRIMALTGPQIIATQSGSTREVRKVVLSSYLGSTLEYYDFLLFGTAAALVFGPVFFDGMSPAAATVASLGTFATGYLARPLGGLVFGHLGDRVGRKSMLVLSLTGMGGASVLIGLIPSSTSIGSLAPILLILLRVVQGIAIGGEWGGAVLMSLEHAGNERRGFVAAFTYAGAPSGALLGTAAMALATRLPDEQFLTWGWRVPFLMSGVMLAIALWVRLSIAESPVFLAAAARAEVRAQQGKTIESPIRGAARQWKTIVMVACSGVAGFAFQTIFATFSITYAVSQGANRTSVLIAFSISQALAAILGLVFARISDRVGRRPVMMVGIAGMAIVVFPAFGLLGTGTFAGAVSAYLLFSLVLTANHGPLPAFIAEQFGTRSRYTGASLGYQSGTLVGAGLMPLAAASLFSAFGRSAAPVAGLIVVLAIVSFAFVALSKETRTNDVASSDF